VAIHLNQQTTPRPYSVARPAGGKSNQTNEFFSLIKSLAIFLGIAFMLKASVVEAFKIPSSSMNSTLEIGDHILVNKLSYGLWFPGLSESAVQFREPKRGDVVVFTLPDNPNSLYDDESEVNIIKRVVGLPGEQVEVRGRQVLINGKSMEDPHAMWQYGGKQDWGPQTVPQGKVFVLGDNRDASKDSRFWDDPFLDISRIKGRAFVIYWNSAFELSRVFQVIR
jgi:signal peptidase I